MQQNLANFGLLSFAR